MSDETIRIGVIGAGANTTSRHIPGLQAIDGVEIIGVCNRSRESSERVAKEFNIPKTYGDGRTQSPTRTQMPLSLVRGPICTAARRWQPWTPTST